MMRWFVFVLLALASAGFGHLGGGGGGGGSSSTPAVELAIATRGVVPAGIQVAVAGTTGTTCRTRHYFGGQNATEVKLVFGGYYTTLSATADIETNLGNDQTVQANIEIPGAPTPSVQVTWSASATGTVVDGAATYVSDRLLPAAFGLSTFTADTQFWVRHSRYVTTGQNFIINQSSAATPTITGEGCLHYDATTIVNNQVNASGALTATGGATTTTQRVLPLAIVGKTVSPAIAVGGLGDSIEQYFNDDLGDGVNGSGGFFQRAMVSVNGHHAAYILLARSSERALNYVQSAKRPQLYQWLTGLQLDYGVNDLNSSRTPAQIRANLCTITTAAAAAGIKNVEISLLTPWTTSTDAWATTVNQTVAANGGNIPTVNAATIASVGTCGLGNYIDYSSVASPVGQPTLWAVTGAANYATSDGLHPEPAMHGLIAPVLNARVATWSP